MRNRKWRRFESMGFRYHVARLEEIVKNRDPRDAWMIVQRIVAYVRLLTRSLPFVRQKVH